MILDRSVDVAWLDVWGRPLTALVILGGSALVAVLVAVLVFVAARRLRSAYTCQQRRFARCRLTGREVVGQLLQRLGLTVVAVEDGAPLVHYDHVRRRVKLRTESSVSSSVAALAIAAHEVGHAEQFATGYWAARATRGLVVFLVFGAAVLLVYPFASTIVGASEVNLTWGISLIALFALMRAPVTLALEADATRRAHRLLAETGLADASEQQGVARLLRAAFFTHVAFNVALVAMIFGGVGMMWVVETGLHDDLPMLPLLAVAVSVSTVSWAFSGGSRKKPSRTAADANNEGMARFQAGDLAGALTLIGEALRRDPGLAAAHYNRAVVLTSQGRRPEALASIDAMFVCRPEEVAPLVAVADPWYLRGTLRLDQGNFHGALEDLTRAYDLEPSDPSILLCNRGLARLKLGQLEQALEDTNQALALTPDNAVAYNNRGVIYRDLGNLEQAEHDLRRAIAIDPQLPNPREHLEKLLQAGPEALI